MPRTKADKRKKVKDTLAGMGGVQSLVITGFNALTVPEMEKLRRSLRENEGTVEVYKKRLLRVLLKEKGIEFDPKDIEGQLGVIFGKGDVSSIAQPAYMFSKEKEQFTLAAGIDLAKGEVLSSEMVRAIGSLPPRPVLLAQLLGAFTGPIRACMYLLQERAKQLEIK